MHSAAFAMKTSLLPVLCLLSGCVVDSTPEEQLATSSSALTIDQQIAASSCSTPDAVVKGLSDQVLAEIATCLKPGVLVAVPSGGGIANGATNQFMVKAAADALKKAAASRPGDTLNVSSMYRTIVEQYFYWRRSSCYPAVAAPGASNHETGIAVDISDPDNSSFRAALTAQGFKWLGSFDRFHFDYVGGGTVNLRGQDVLAFQRLWNRNNPADKIAEDGGWGAQTEARMKKSPTTGFPIGACASTPSPPPPTPWPGLEVDADAEAADRFSDGLSAAVPDVMEGDEYVVNLVVRNTGTAAAADVTLGVWIEEPFVRAVRYEIESDWGSPGTFKLNDANDRTDNPPHDNPGSTFAVKMNGVSPKETKRIRLRMRAAQYSIGAADSPDVRVWVQDVPGVYAKADFSAAAKNVENRQTFNGGDLKAWAPVDVYSRTRWSFDGGMLEGWSEGGSAEVTAEAKENGLVITSKGEDPYAVSPETSFPASEFSALAITATGAGAVRLYFATSDAMAFDEARTVDFMLPAAGKQSLVINLAQHAGWKGTITRLRIDPIASLEIDDIRLTSGSAQPVMPIAPTAVPAADDAPVSGSCGCEATGGGSQASVWFLGMFLTAARAADARRARRARSRTR